MASQYRHVVPLNSKKFICNHNLFDVFAAKGIQDNLLVATLNSTLIVLFKHQFGRIMGIEGNLKTEVVDAKMMVIPNPQVASKEISKKIISAFDLMRRRKALPMIDVDSTDEENWTGELALADRQALDDSVLELIGIADAEERKELRDELYREITKLYRQIRVAEKTMQKFRSASARKGKQTAHSIADEIWTELTPQPTALTPLKFVPDKTKTEKINLPLGRARVVTQGLLGTSDLQVGDKFIPLGSVERSNFVKTLSDLALYGELEIPFSPEICQNALRHYEKEFGQLNDLFYSEAATFTADENLKEKVVKELWKKLRSS